MSVTYHAPPCPACGRGVGAGSFCTCSMHGRIHALRRPRPRLPFYSDCVTWPRDELAALSHICDEGRQVTRATFMRRADVGPEPARQRTILGTWTHEDVAGFPWPEPWDYHVAYFTLAGWPVAWFVHSATEYVFADQEVIHRLSLRVYDLRAAA